MLNLHLGLNATPYPTGLPSSLQGYIQLPEDTLSQLSLPKCLAATYLLVRLYLPNTEVCKVSVLGLLLSTHSHSNPI